MRPADTEGEWIASDVSLVHFPYGAPSLPHAAAFYVRLIEKAFP